MENVIIFGLGMFVASVLMILGYSISGMLKLRKKVMELRVSIRHIDELITRSSADNDLVVNSIYQCIDDEKRNINDEINDIRIGMNCDREGIYRDMDSRLDKLENRIKGQSNGGCPCGGSCGSKVAKQQLNG